MITATWLNLHCLLATTCSIKTQADITAMHIHNGTLAAQGGVGVQLYPSNATLKTYGPDDTLTVYAPVDATALAKAVYPDMAAFIKVTKLRVRVCLFEDGKLSHA